MRLVRALAFMAAALLILGGATACASASTVGSPATPTATLPAPTATLPPVPMRAVTFSTADHIQLAGEFLGSGQTVVIFSNQTDSYASDWLPIARQFAARGYGALVYDYRGTRESQGQRNISAGPTDLKAAIAFAKQQQGARHIVLIWASIGGTITANAAVVVPVAAVAILSSPSVWPGLDVTDAVMRAITAPKFLADSEGDEYASDIQGMYNAANQPKELHIYPGSDHGIALFDGDNATMVLQQLLAFVQRYAAAG